MFEELRRRNVHRVAIAYLAGAWLLLQIADVLWDIYGLPEWILPILANLLAVGLIPALILAWVFEWTPAGIRRDAGTEEGVVQPARDTRRIDRAIIVVLALAVTLLVIDRFVLRETEHVSTHAERIEALRSGFGSRSIAVLEFENLSGDPEQAYFAAGVTESILNLLAKIDDLRVVPSVSPDLASQGIEQIGKALEISYVLQGSVRSSGDDVRITARLINAQDTTSVWSETYTRTLTDVFAIQDDIANQVAQQLEIDLTGRSLRSWTTRPDLYLDFMQVLREFRSGTSDPAHVATLESILEQDPEYLPAITMLWLKYREMVLDEGTDAQRIEELLSKRARLLDRALALAPDDAIVNAIHAWTLFEVERDLVPATAAMERAYRLQPGSVQMRQYATAFARRIKKYDVANTISETSIAIDPSCLGCYLQIAYSSYRQRRFDESIWASQLRHKLGGLGGWYTLGFAQLLSDDAEGALASFDRQPMDGAAGWHASRAMALYSLGRTSEFEAARQAAERDPPAQQAIYLALMYAWIGEPDPAFAELERAYEGGDFRVADRVVAEPIFDPLRKDPRWDALVQQVWYTDEELAAVTLNIP
jgi:TolB-like protein